MGRENRIRGQDVVVSLLREGVTEASCAAIKDFSLSVDAGTSAESFLGRTSDTYDEMYQGISGSLTFQHTSPQALDMLRRILDRQQRRDNTTVFSIKATLNYPDGSKRRAVINDISFEGFSMLNFSGRASYNDTQLAFKAGEPPTFI